MTSTEHQWTTSASGAIYCRECGLEALTRSVAEVMDPRAVVDCALRSEAAWRVDADRYAGRRREVRLERAERLHAVAERVLEEV